MEIKLRSMDELILKFGMLAPVIQQCRAYLKRESLKLGNKSMYTLRILLLATLIVACAQDITYQVTYLPIPLPETINHTAVVHRLDSTTNIMDNRKKNQLFHMAYATFSAVLQDNLKADSRFTVNTDTTIAEKPFSKATLERPINQEYMKKLTEHIGKDLLIVIENFNVYKTDGFTIEDGETQKYSTVYVAATLSLYDRSATRIKRTILEAARQVDRGESVFWFETFPGGLFGPSLKRYKDLIYEMAGELAKEFMQRFHQRSERVTRTANSGSRFKGFGTMIQTGRFEQAEALLLPLTQDSEYDMLMKAAYNMYILREAEGRFDESEEWLKKYKFYQNKLRQQYEKN